MKLRPYQQEAREKIHEGFKEFDRQLAVKPTGAGKTILFAALASDYANEDQKTLILAHREELIFQAVQKIAMSTGIFAQVEKAESRASLEAPVVVGSIQTMQRRMTRFPKDHFDLVVADEAHHAISNSWLEVLNYFDAKILGVTATPDRGDKKNLGQFFENVAFEISLVELIKQKYLCPIKVRALPLEINLKGVRTTMGDFNDSDLGDALAPYLRTIAKAIKEHAPNRKTLAFLPLVATSQNFVRICNEEGIIAQHIDGNSTDRKEILRDYSRGKYQLLSNAMLLTEGYDEPTIDCVLNLRPTKSRPLYSQMVGRGTRIHPTKSDLLLLDFLWMHEKHNLIRPAHLIATNDEMAQAMTKLTEAKAGYGDEQAEMDLMGLESSAREQREEKLREELAAKSKRKGKTIDAMEFCLSLGDVDLADYEPTMKWESKGVSPKQAEILQRMGIDVGTIKGQGHASALLSKIFDRQKMKMATPKQIQILKRLGHFAPETATFEQASQFLDARIGTRKIAA